MTSFIWIPKWLYRLWPILILIMSLGYFFLGYETMGIFLLVYVGWILYLRWFEYLFEE